MNDRIFVGAVTCALFWGSILLFLVIKIGIIKRKNNRASFLYLVPVSTFFATVAFWSYYTRDSQRDMEMALLFLSAMCPYGMAYIKELRTGKADVNTFASASVVTGLLANLMVLLPFCF